MKYKNIGEIVYCAIKLDDPSRNKLLELTKKLIPEKLDGVISSWRLYCDHLTLGFGNNVTPDMVKLIGSPVVGLNPYRILIDDICCGVFFQDKSLTSRGIPWKGSDEHSKVHITLACKIGVAPIVAGTITERNHTVLIADPTFTMSGKIGVFVEDGNWYFE